MSYNSLPRVRPELHLTYSRHAPLNKGVAISSALSHKRGDGGDAAHGCGCSSGVEHNLAKVGVEGSNPFARSSNSLKSLIGRRMPGGPSRSPAQNRTCRHAPNAGKFREAGFCSVPVGPHKTLRSAPRHRQRCAPCTSPATCFPPRPTRPAARTSAGSEHRCGRARRYRVALAPGDDDQTNGEPRWRGCAPGRLDGRQIGLLGRAASLGRLKGL
jgi:hypothetical protein